MDIEFIQKIIDSIELASKDNNTDLFCKYRDVFQARLDSFAQKTNKYLESAVIGEIGNNTFDHNLDFSEGKMRGAYFNPDFEGFVVLADYGQGVRKSLSKIRLFDSDIEALKTAFTERVSGRAPEQRGNGLKFVTDSFLNKRWMLYFQSGAACCKIENGEVCFKETNFLVDGCLAVMKF